VANGVIFQVPAPHNHIGLVNKDLINKRIAKQQLRCEMAKAIETSGMG